VFSICCVSLCLCFFFGIFVCEVCDGEWCVHDCVLVYVHAKHAQHPDKFISMLCHTLSMLCPTFSILCPTFSVLCPIFSMLCHTFSISCHTFVVSHCVR